MGKSYKAWSKELGTVYIEEDSGIDTRGNENKSNYLNQLLRQLGPVDDYSDYKRQKHINQKELILQKMTEDEKADYEKHLKSFEDEITALVNKCKEIEKVINRRLKLRSFLPVIIAILLWFPRIISNLKVLDVGSIVGSIVLIWITYFIIEKIFSSSLFYRLFIFPLNAETATIKSKIDIIKTKSRDYIYNYTTEFISPYN